MAVNLGYNRQRNQTQGNRERRNQDQGGSFIEFGGAQSGVSSAIPDFFSWMGKKWQNVSERRREAEEDLGERQPSSEEDEWEQYVQRMENKANDWGYGPRQAGVVQQPQSDALTWTDQDLQRRYGGSEPDVQFGGQRGFASAGASDAEMLEAMGGAPSQDTIDEMNKMIRNQQISQRMEAGDYEDMGAEEFGRMVEGERDISPATPDAIQAAEASRESFTAPTMAARDQRKRTGVNINPEWTPEEQIRAASYNRTGEPMGEEGFEGFAELLGTRQETELTGQQQRQTQQQQYELDRALQQMEGDQELRNALMEVQAEAATEGQQGMPQADIPAGVWTDAMEQSRSMLRQSGELDELSPDKKATRISQLGRQLVQGLYGQGTQGQEEQVMSDLEELSAEEFEQKYGMSRELARNIKGKQNQSS